MIKMIKKEEKNTRKKEFQKLYFEMLMFRGQKEKDELMKEMEIL